MKVTCIQMNIRFTDPEQNYSHALQLMEQAMAENPDVLVLPENWNTGFFKEEQELSLADRDGEQVKARIGAFAKKHRVNIVAGSVSDIRNGKCHNTSYVFDRQGNCIAHYDKVHLFSPSGEGRFYASGDQVCRFQLDGIPCGVIICYDLRFPELTRMLTVPGIDVLFLVAQWPAVRTAHLQSLIAARAIENQIFLVCCNACGKAGDTHCAGSSAAVDPWGKTLAQAGVEEQLLSAQLDFSILQNIRTSINVFADRRPEVYGM